MTHSYVRSATSVRRGTDKTGPTIATPEKSVDKNFRARRLGINVVAILVISPGRSYVLSRAGIYAA